MANGNGLGARIQFNEDVVAARSREFLENLATSDRFREDFLSSRERARDVLGEYGIEISIELVPDPVELPSKHYVERFLAELDEREELGIPKPERLAYGMLWNSLAAFAMPIVAADEQLQDAAR
jgi:hypothetical protein